MAPKSRKIAIMGFRAVGKPMGCAVYYNCIKNGSLNLKGQL